MPSSVVAYSQSQQLAFAVYAVNVGCQIGRVRLHRGFAQWEVFPAVANHKVPVVLVVNASAS